jgi:hypothetical protein
MKRSQPLPQLPSAPLGISQLIDSDLELVDMYHTLATRHDALVDYLEKQMTKQEKQ